MFRRHFSASTSVQAAHSFDTIIAIDSAIADLETLVSTVLPGAMVLLLDRNRDGVEQITEALAKHSAAHLQIVAHGVPGCLYIGNSKLSLETITHYTDQFQTWFRDQPVSSISLYACNVAAGDAGAEFLDKLHRLTGAEIHASTTAIGHALLGGGWELDVTYPTASQSYPFPFQTKVIEAYTGILGDYYVDNTGDADDGNYDAGNLTLREAIKLANGQTGKSTIHLSEIKNQTILLNGSLEALKREIEIKGYGVTISGQDQYQILTVASGQTVTLSDLTLKDGLAKGGDGSNGGGGGLGAGGALFIDEYATVTATNITFESNKAQGGSAYDDARGGNADYDDDALLGPSVPPATPGEGGGTGGRLNATGSSYYNQFTPGSGGSGGAGGDDGSVGDDGQPGSAGSGGAFGSGGGGGGAGGGADRDYSSPGGTGGAGGTGGTGGFGAGGGAGGGGGGTSSNYDGKSGGTGAAGGTFGGSGTSGGQTYKGNTSGAAGGAGGGGAGLGGAIFVRANATLNLSNATFKDNLVAAGMGNDGNISSDDGQAQGDNIFTMAGATVNTTVALDEVAEDPGVPTGAVGTAVATLVTRAVGTAGQGIAITQLNTNNGTWWYSTNGSTWSNSTSVSANSALFLDANARLYFQPAQDKNGLFGTATDPLLTFRLWSGAVVPSGTQADVTNATNGASGSDIKASINVTSVYDAPVIQNISKTGNEDDLSINLSQSDFTSQFSSVEAGKTLEKIKITSLPTSGKLEWLDDDTWRAVTIGQEIDLVNIDGKLRFKPATNFNGSVSFNWNGKDDVGYAAKDAAINLTVNWQNDAPILKADINKTVDEEKTLAFHLADFTSAFSDIADTDAALNQDPNIQGNGLKKIKIIAPPGNGKLFLNGVEITTANYEIDANQLDQLTFTPDRDFAGEIGFNWQGSDGKVYAPQTKAVVINVKGINEAPSLLNLSNRQIDENVAPRTLIGELDVKDPDQGDKFTYKLVDGAGSEDNNAFVIENNKLLIKDSPDYETQSRYNVRIRATDSQGLSYEKIFGIAVNDLKETPRVGEKIKSQAARSGVLFEYRIPEDTFKDPEGNALKYSAQLADGKPLPNWLKFAPQTRTFSGKPNRGDVGTLPVKITATDSENLSTNQTFDIKVTEAYGVKQTVDGLTASLDRIQQMVDQQMGQSVPLVGSLKDITPHFAQDVKTELAKTEAEGEDGAVGLKKLQQIVENALKPAFNDVDVKVEERSKEEVRLTLDVKNTYQLGNIPLGSDLGLPGVLSLQSQGQAEGKFEYGLELGFGYHKKFGFFVDTEDTKLGANLGIGLSDDFKATANLGFLQLDLEENSPDAVKARRGKAAQKDDKNRGSFLGGEFELGLNDLDNIQGAPDDGDRLTLQELLKKSANDRLFHGSFAVNPRLDLHARTSLQGSKALPSFDFDFKVDWKALKYEFGKAKETESADDSAKAEATDATTVKAVTIDELITRGNLPWWIKNETLRQSRLINLDQFKNGGYKEENQRDHFALLKDSSTSSAVLANHLGWKAGTQQSSPAGSELEPVEVEDATIDQLIKKGNLPWWIKNEALRNDRNVDRDQFTKAGYKTENQTIPKDLKADKDKWAASPAQKPLEPEALEKRNSKYKQDVLDEIQELFDNNQLTLDNEQAVVKLPEGAASASSPHTNETYKQSVITEVQSFLTNNKLAFQNGRIVETAGATGGTSSSNPETSKDLSEDGIRAAVAKGDLPWWVNDKKIANSPEAKQTQNGFKYTSSLTIGDKKASNQGVKIIPGGYKDGNDKYVALLNGKQPWWEQRGSGQTAAQTVGEDKAAQALGEDQSSIQFNDMKLDLGTFISDFAKPILKSVNDVVTPVRPAIQFLNQDTKLVSEIGLGSLFDQNNDGKVTVVEIAATIARKKIDTRFLTALDYVDKASRLVDELSQEEGTIKIDFGSHKIAFAEKQQPGGTQITTSKPTSTDLPGSGKATGNTGTAETAAVNNQLDKKTSQSKVGQLIDTLNKIEGLKFPILSQPATAIELLLGKPGVTLFEYDMPDLNFDFEIQKSFPIWGPISGMVEGKFKAKTDLAFGFDTYGLDQWKADSFKAAASYKAFDGFFVADLPGNELQLEASIAVGAGLDVLVASGYVKGGIKGFAGIDLVDVGEAKGTSDEKLHFSEFFDRPLTASFNLNGGVDIFLGAEINAAGKTVWEKNFATFPLLRFNVGGDNGGKTSNKYVAGAAIFFDANFNGVQDTNEPLTISNADATYTLDVPVADFDRNGNGVLDLNEGRRVSLGGTDTGTYLEMDIQMAAPVPYTMITPVTSLVSALVQQGVDLKQAEAQVKAALGLSAELDLSSFDATAAIQQNNAQGMAMMSAHVQIHNLVSLTSSLIQGVWNRNLIDISEQVTRVIADQAEIGKPLNFQNANWVQNLIEASVARVQTLAPEQNWQQVLNVATAAAAVIAAGNQRVAATMATSSFETVLKDVSKVQKILLTETALDLKQTVAGKISVDTLTAENTGAGFDAEIAKLDAPPPYNLMVGGEAANKLKGANKDDLMVGLNGNDRMLGQGGNDLIGGDQGKDWLDGGEGNDELKGSQGRDTLIGGKGNDNLVGGEQGDVLIGNQGKDVFHLDVLSQGVDQIKDFSVRADVIEIMVSADTPGLKSGKALAKAQFQIGVKATDRNDRLIYNQNTGALFFDADGLGGIKQVQLAKLSAGLEITHQSFAIS